MEKKKKKKNNKKSVATWVIAVVAIICIVIGVFEIRDSFIKLNRAAGYSEKILNLFLKSEEK